MSEPHCFVLNAKGEKKYFHSLKWDPLLEETPALLKQEKRHEPWTLLERTISEYAKLAKQSYGNFHMGVHFGEECSQESAEL